MERREAPGCLRGAPGEPCEGPPRAVAIRRAHPSDVGVRRLPALHRGVSARATFSPRRRRRFASDAPRSGLGESCCSRYVRLGMLSREPLGVVGQFEIGVLQEIVVRDLGREQCPVLRKVRYCPNSKETVLFAVHGVPIW